MFLLFYSSYIRVRTSLVMFCQTCIHSEDQRLVSSLMCVTKFFVISSLIKGGATKQAPNFTRRINCTLFAQLLCIKQRGRKSFGYSWWVMDVNTQIKESQQLKIPFKIKFAGL